MSLFPGNGRAAAEQQDAGLAMAAVTPAPVAEPALDREDASGLSSSAVDSPPSPVSSMTGYARIAGRISDALSFTLTLKSINHRYLDLQLRMPAGTEALESAIRQRLKQQLVRGHVECVLMLERNRPGRQGSAAASQSPVDQPAANGGAGAAPSHSAEGRIEVATPRTAPVFDPAAVAAYLSVFRETARLHGLNCEPDLNHMARLPGMLLVEPAVTIDRSAEVADEEALAREILSRLGEVLAALRAMRAEEGRSLAAILRDGLERLESMVEEVAQLRSLVQDAHFVRIRHRLQSLLGSHFEQDRILQEAALLAERSDVEEEVARMKTHIDHFRALLAAGGELGKKLDFLLQEMNREANTLLSKTAGVTGNGTRITACGLAMKAEIEKAREQVQNLE